MLNCQKKILIDGIGYYAMNIYLFLLGEIEIFLVILNNLLSSMQTTLSYLTRPIDCQMITISIYNEFDKKQ